MRCSGRSGRERTWSRHFNAADTVRAPVSGPSLCIEGVDALVGGYGLLHHAIGDGYEVRNGDVVGAALDDGAQAAEVEDEGLGALLTPGEFAVQRPPGAAHVGG